MNSAVKALISHERVLLDHAAFDVLGIPKHDFYQLGSSGLLLAILDDKRSKTELDNEFEVVANKKFDMLCNSAPGVSRDAIRSICMAYTSYEYLFGEYSKEKMTETEAVTCLLSIVESRGFALGAAKSKPSASEIMRKKLLSRAGEMGARSKHRPTAELKAWAEQQAKTMRGSDMDKSRQLATRIPEHLADASRASVRLIYDHLRSLKRNTAS